MKPILSYGAARVYDDILPEKLHQQIWSLLNSEPFVRTDAQLWAKVWTLADGAILRSHEWAASAPNWNVTENPPNPQQQRKPPAGLSDFVKHLNDILASHTELPDFQHMVLIPYIWPPKTSISWHQDGNSIPNRIGAFTFYAHKEWNAEWGGEFLMTDIEGQFASTPFDNSETSNAIVAKGHGVWLTPKPNRLVVNPSGMLHKVAKTTEAAPARLTIQGFLYS